MGEPDLLNRARAHIAVALDLPDLGAAADFADEVAPFVGVFKVGLELFVRYGPEAVSRLGSGDRRLFLDLKLCDIPETVERAVAAASDLGVAYLTVHASGGSAMLERAQARAGKTKLLAVTLLTSLGETDLASLGVAGGVTSQVDRLHDLAYAQGIRGFVCSPAEVTQLRALRDDTFLVTPGIRPLSGQAGDQKRVATPKQATERGSNLLVVGRPLRDAPDRAAAAEALLQEVAEGLS